MITTSWNEDNRQYLAWDPEYLSHVCREGISKANAIARVEHNIASIKAGTGFITVRLKKEKIK